MSKVKSTTNKKDVNIYSLRALTFFLTQASAALIGYTSYEDCNYDKEGVELIAFAINKLSCDIDSQLEMLGEASITWKKDA